MTTYSDLTKLLIFMARYDKIKKLPEFQLLSSLGYTVEHVRILLNSELLRSPIRQLMRGTKSKSEFIYAANAYLSAKRAGLYSEGERTMHNFIVLQYAESSQIEREE